VAIDKFLLAGLQIIGDSPRIPFTVPSLMGLWLGIVI